MAIYKNTPPIVTNGLVLHLDAGSRQSYPGSGATWSDLSGTNNTTTLVSSPPYNNRNQGGITFTNATNYATSSYNSTYDFSGTKSVTFSCWLTLTSNNVGNYPGIAGFEDPSTGGAAYAMIFIDTTGIGFVRYSSAFVIDVSLSVNVTYGTIYNIVGTYDGATLKMYSNGVQIGSAASVVSLSAITKNLQIGRRPSSAGGVFTLYNFSIYNRALSAQEVNQNYNALKSRFGLT